ncbi:MAG: hypothetical protein M1818_005764 [Claussenomyces sp. TS43310]|nr:MAG: hypothetical protein M1818_005764 [Claussenomyces sp. TS43310]
MVGVPGRSKGCHTCRRRKVKCDLQRPECERCARSSILCDGYSRFPVFLNRTAQGLQKRAPLEEIQPKQNPASQAVSNRTVKNPDLAVGGAVPASSQQYLNGEAANGRIPQQVSDVTVILNRLQGVFVESYLPSNRRDGAGSASLWILDAICLSHPGPALESSFRALSTVRAGRERDNPAIAAQGRLFYGRALRELQVALSNPDLMGSDETLAACKMMALYEFFESTSNSIRGHQSHTYGTARLLRFQRPTVSETPLRGALKDNIVFSAMILCLQYRTTVPFADLLPYIQDWPGPKSTEQQLCHVGFRLAAIYEQIDQISVATSTDVKMYHVSNALKFCSIVSKDLSSWYRELLHEPAYPTSWPQFLSRFDAHGRMHEQQDEPQAAFSFPCLRLAHQMLGFWTFQMRLSTAVSLLHEISSKVGFDQTQTFDGTASQLPEPVPTLNDALFPNSDSAHEYMPLGIPHDAAHHVELATNIVRGTPYCLGHDMGLASAQRCIFYLNNALFTLRRHPCQMLTQCEELFHELAFDKGLHFARDILRVSGGSRDTQEPEAHGS